jgi:protein SCO1/2/putative membrane protein
VNTSYRLGIFIVSSTILASLVVCMATVSALPNPIRAGQELGDNGFQLGSFALVERSGRAVTEADLTDRVWIASFIFTRCPLSCPRISSVMKGLQERVAGSGVLLVSLSVDPEYDTPAVLADYARRFGAEADRWWFLTGEKAQVYDLIGNRFKLPIQPSSPGDQQMGAESVMHSERLALVVRGGKVAGVFDSTDPSAVDALVQKARTLDAGGPPSWVRRLPAVNVMLNGSCALLLAVGWVLIRARNVRGHATCMIASASLSGLFLISYLTYHFHVRSVPFQGIGPVRLVYFTVLLSHTLLATFGVVPLVTLTLAQAILRRFDRHARIAGLTFPIWMYVSLTGIIIYVMLYAMPVPVLSP